MMKNGISYFRISFCAIQVFVQTFMTSQTAEMTVMNLKIENISENIGVLIFKFGTSNVHHLRHKGSIIETLPYQHSRFQSPSAMNQISWIFKR